MTIGRLLAVGQTESGGREAQSWKSEKSKSLEKVLEQKWRKAKSVGATVCCGGEVTGVATGGGRDFEEFEAIHRFPKRRQRRGNQETDKRKTGNRKQFKAIHRFANRSLERKRKQEKENKKRKKENRKQFGAIHRFPKRSLGRKGYQETEKGNQETGQGNQKQETF